MNTKHHGFSFFSAKSFFHNFSPDTTGSTEFCNFFKYVVMSIPEEGETTCESINVKTSFDSCFNVSDTISNSKCDFLRSSRTSFTNMVTGNGDCVPFWYIFRAIFKDVSDKTHRWTWWEDICSTSSIFFKNIVLDCTF